LHAEDLDAVAAFKKRLLCFLIGEYPERECSRCLVVYGVDNHELDRLNRRCGAFVMGTASIAQVVERVHHRRHVRTNDDHSQRLQSFQILRALYCDFPDDFNREWLQVADRENIEDLEERLGRD